MRILFLSQRLPYAPNRGDRVRAFHLLRQLRPMADIDVVSFVHDEEEASHATELRGWVSSVETVLVPKIRNTLMSGLRLAGSRPTTHTMLDAPGLDLVIDRVITRHPPDVVLAYCSGVARLAMAPPLDRIPLVLDMVDVDSAKWIALSEKARFPLSWVYQREARLLSIFEGEVARRAFATVITTDKERSTLLELAPTARVDVVQNGVDASALKPKTGPADSQTVVFCGVMNYAPNEEGAVWIAREVWPLVRQRVSSARLQLVGSSPTPQVQALANAVNGIEVTGHVADVRDYLWKAAVAAAPLLTARGVQNKVLEAVAAGLPTVVTPLVMQGVPPEVQAGCVLADGAAAFADALVRLLQMTPADRRAMAERADLRVLSWERRLEGMPDLIRNAAASR